MKKFIIVLTVLFAVAGTTSAQEIEFSAPHNIVFQLQTEDTLVHKSLMKQLNNILTISPESKIEVVCHGPGIKILMNEHSIVKHKIAGLTKKGVVFNACEFTMTERKLTKAQMIPDAGYVEYGILEIVGRQEQGWSYIKSGF